MTDIHHLQEVLTSYLNIVITTHRKPDGDAMGASLGMYNILCRKGHKVHVIAPTEFAEFYKWLPGSEDILVYTEQEQNCANLTYSADLIFCLDYNSLNRVNEMGHYINHARGHKVLIDHHPDPDGFADYNFSEPQASSTAEMVYDFLEMIDYTDYLNKEVAECLYTGIMTDTGGFMFAGTTPRVHRIVAHLLDLGVESHVIYNKIFNTYRESRLRLIGYCLKEKMIIYPELKTGFIYLSKKELEDFDVKTGDTEGLVNYPLKLKDVVFSALLTERGDIVKISFRSKGEFDVNQFARKHFEGGGHKNAAGGISHASLDETVNKFVNHLSNYHTLIH